MNSNSEMQRFESRLIGGESWRDPATATRVNERKVRSANYGPGRVRPPPARAFLFDDVMTSDDRLSLILRRLDEIEGKLDRMLDELRSPTAIGYSSRRGNRPRND